MADRREDAKAKTVGNYKAAMTYLSVFPRNYVEAGSPVIRRVIEKTIIGNYAPKSPPLNSGSRVISIGSCFAHEITKILQTKGLNAQRIPMAETSNSAFALDRYLAHFLDGEPLGFRGGDKIEEVPADIFSDVFRKSDLVVITFGLSLIWCDSTGNFALGPPNTNANQAPATSNERADAGYYMRQSSVEENESKIRSCIARVRSTTNAPIVLTLSPIPLLGTRHDIPAVDANARSKATLLLALDGVIRSAPEGVYYWPSYEIVTWYGNHVDRAFGDDRGDARHVRQPVIDLIGDLFVQHYVS